MQKKDVHGDIMQSESGLQLAVVMYQGHSPAFDKCALGTEMLRVEEEGEAYTGTLLHLFCNFPMNLKYY